MPHEPSTGTAARALALAYAYLNRRERTTSEVRGHLCGKGFDDATVDAALTELVEEGTLDDTRFARLFTADKRELERWGTDRIRRTLLQRGLDPETVSAALQEDDGDQRHSFAAELGRAVELLRRRFPSPPDNRRDRDRALGMLVRKGYELELALDALAAYARGD